VRARSALRLRTPDSHPRAPLQVAFLDSGRNDIIWYFDRFVDFFFLVDIVINFNLCYYDDVRKRYVQSRLQVAIRCAGAPPRASRAGR
jgi:hypothetical protein